MLIDLVKPVLENPLLVKYGLLTLFLNTLFSSFIPIPVVMTSTALLLNGQDIIIIFSVMLTGAIIGGVLTYIIGYDGKKIYKLLIKRHRVEHYEKSFRWFNKYGWIVICVLSFIPILVEVITIIAGIKRYNFKKFIITMSIGRAVHVFAIVYLGNMIIQYFNYFKF